MTQRMTVTPDPLQEGEQGTVCYDFEGLSISETDIRITWSPSRSSEIVGVSVSDPCATFTVPDGQTSASFVDLDGSSSRLTVSIQ